MKITRRKLRELILTETQRIAGLPDEQDLGDISVDNKIVDRALQIYNSFSNEYTKDYMSREDQMLFNILRNRIVNLGRLMNPTDPNFDKIQADLARWRQSRLKEVLMLFGGRQRKFSASSSVYAFPEKAEEYERKWFETFQRILGGKVFWDDHENLWIGI